MHGLRLGFSHGKRPEYADVYPVIKTEFLLCGLVSLGCSLLLIFLHFLLPRVRRTPGWFVQRAAACEAVVSGCFVALYFFGHADLEHSSHVPSNPALWALLLALSAFEVAANAWRLLVYLDLVNIYRNPFAPDRYRPLYPVIVVVLAIATAGASYLAVEPVGPGGEKAALQVLAVGFVFMPFAIFVVVGGTLYMLVRLLVLTALRGAMRNGHPPSITFLARQRVMRHGTAYLLLHGSQLTITVLLLLLLLYSDLPAAFDSPSAPQNGALLLWHVLAILVCARPAFSFAGWLVINDVVYLFFGVCSFTKPWVKSASSPLRRRHTTPVLPFRARTAREQPKLLASAPSPASAPQSTPLGAPLCDTSLASAPHPRPSPVARRDAPQPSRAVSGGGDSCSGRESRCDADAVDGDCGGGDGVGSGGQRGAVGGGAAATLSSAAGPYGSSFGNGASYRVVEVDLGGPDNAHDDAGDRDTWWRRLRSAAASASGVDEVGFKEEIRFELVYDVAVGIGELAAFELRAEEALACGAPWRASVDLGTLGSGSSATRSPLVSFAATLPPAVPSSAGMSAAAEVIASRRDSMGADSAYSSGQAAPGVVQGRAATPTLPPPFALAKQPTPQSLLSADSPATSCTWQPPRPTPAQTQTQPQTLTMLRTQAASRSPGAPSHRRSSSTPGQHFDELKQVRDSLGSLVLRTSEASGQPNAAAASAAPSIVDAEKATLMCRAASLTGLSEALFAQPLGPARPSPTVTSVPISRSQSEGLLGGRANTRRQPAEGAVSRSAALHYEVDRFRNIRQCFGVTAAMYAHAFPHDLSELGSRWRQRLKESVSEGASGSFFYRVLSSARGEDGPSSRFIVKQITRREKRTLMAMLPAYQAYVAQRAGRSLIQYFGCHSMSLRWQFSGKIYFVVMRNFLPTRAWLTFDLKGATANRRALAAKFLHQVHARAKAAGGSAYGTLRDWEWLDIAMVVDVADEAKASLAEMIASDAHFLRSQGLLDYSLFVGIHRLSPSLSSAQRQQRLAQLRARGGYVSLDRQKVYFFGIIDVLERYTMRWKCQRAVLTAGYHLLLRGGDADGISALSPEEYADRFYTFALREVLQVPRYLSLRRQESLDGAHFLRHNRCCFCFRCCISNVVRGSIENDARWGKLWQRRRRGLVKERIECERADHMRRIAELERALSATEATGSRGVP